MKPCGSYQRASVRRTHACRHGNGSLKTFSMFNTYDNIFQGTSVASSTLTGSTPVTGAAVDTELLDNGMIHVRAEQTTSNPSVATATVTVTECATSGGTYTAANDNTGNPISLALDVHAAAADGFIRLEGLGLNRKRFIKIVVTPAFTGGTSPAIVVYGEILASPRSARPIRTTVSNT